MQATVAAAAAATAAAAAATSLALERVAERSGPGAEQLEQRQQDVDELDRDPEQTFLPRLPAAGQGGTRAQLAALVHHVHVPTAGGDADGRQRGEQRAHHPVSSFDAGL